jgi:hypothetical protein
LLQLEEETEHYHDFPYDFTWAASSDGIVVVSTNCQNQWCEPKFQLYAIPSHELLTSALFNTVTTRVCDLRLAAGMQYLSFVTPCEPDIPATQFYEVFIWDTQSGAFTQVTHYTNELSGLSINAPAFITVYDGIWLTNQEFLLSVFNIERAPDQALPETGLHQTAIYAPPFTSQTLLTYTHATGYEWVKNPLTGDLAYREETYTYSPWPEIDTASVRIATFENHTTHPAANLSCWMAPPPLTRTVPSSATRGPRTMSKSPPASHPPSISPSANTPSPSPSPITMVSPPVIRS